MNIVQIATYPIEKPLHGGQIRVNEISKELKRLGANVINVSYSEPSHRYFNKDLDFIINPASLEKYEKTPYCTDLATSIMSQSEEDFSSHLLKSIAGKNIDYIFIEQMWLWPMIKRLLKESKISGKSKIVYSSHNIEFLTKEALLSSNGIQNYDDAIKKIKEIETDLVLNSDIIISCSKSDYEFYSEMNLDAVSILCPNGVSLKEINPETLERVKDGIGDRKFALFVGSAYPPNAQGFWSVIGESVAWLSMDEMIVAAGGCSNILEDFMPTEYDIYRYLNFEKIKRVGFLDDDELCALIHLCSAIILPITVGGGSNLKTAEAIISNKPVISTSVACRGYDFCDELSNFYICDDREGFINAIKASLRNERMELSENELNLRSSVLWNNALKGLEFLVDN
ncbi:hypothetical protein [Cycloclasticus pugetii]|uniref:hypothetical protein n=1 Tax=Cycloclasticus pugetii TaxID=34068 RepID=UPI003A94B709